MNNINENQYTDWMPADDCLTAEEWSELKNDLQWFNDHNDDNLKGFYRPGRGEVDLYNRHHLNTRLATVDGVAVLSESGNWAITKWSMKQLFRVMEVL